MKKILTILGILLILCAARGTYAQDARVREYAGITEFDKGEGVYAIEKSCGYHICKPAAIFWGGAIAEFIRRHPDRQIVTSVPIALHYHHNSSTEGIVLITVPK